MQCLEMFWQLLFSIFCIIFINGQWVDGDSQEGLPFCGVSDSTGRYVLVSTLDGKLNALNPDNGGSLLWSVHPGSEPMLSSSIHRLELTNFGQLVRMIPSLNGGLYKFNGETVEPIPLTADHLLQASFRYSDDLVISGGKESQTVGVSVRTGEVVYECSMRGCKEEDIVPSGDILVVQRQSQVVRAVEPRTGAERWNFSVAQHDLKLMSECHTTGSVTKLNLQVIIPEGLVFALDSEHSDNILWKYKFNSPIVSVWEVSKGQLLPVDLFSRSTQIAQASPSLYVGMHEKQLYIQESVTMMKKRQELAHNYGQNLITHDKQGEHQLPWRPVIANAKNLGIDSALLETSENDTALEESHTTALSVLYASPFVDGVGFYLYDKEDLNGELCNVTIPLQTEEEEDTPAVTVVIVSLWYWWREVAVISITTALIFNFVFTRGLFRFHRVRPQKLSNSDSGISMVLDQPLISEPQPVKEYTSRYLTDFEPIHCLGHGGFGVVFEAKNKVDDCLYAIKRITLPDAVEQRERVMREVKALAKLDHSNIVRYFNAWLEDPPPGWQQEQDLLWKHSLGDSRDTGSLAPSTLPSDTTSKFQSKSEISRLCAPIPEDESSSFIVFESNSQSAEDEEEEGEEEKACEEHAIVIESTRSSVLEISRPKKRRKDCRLKDICHSPSQVYLYIQMQLCHRESLKDWLSKNIERNYDEVLLIFEQIVYAVEYVHIRSLIHRDLKPSNIFFSMDHKIKIGDFGLVTSITDDIGRQSPETRRKHGGDGDHTAQVGTFLYMSPEQLSGKPYSFKVDIFSLGMILFELLVPFGTQMERLRVLQDIKKQKFPKHFIETYKEEFELLQLMLSPNPDKRPTTIGVRNSPPFSKSKKPEDDHWKFEMPPRRRETSVSSADSENQ